MSRAQFRQLIVVLFLLFIAILLVDPLFPSLVPESLRKASDTYLDERIGGLPLKTIVHMLLYFACAVLGPFIGLAYLFFFRRLGRTIFTVLIATLPLSALFVGASVSSWITDLLVSWYYIGVGFALAIAWFSPLKDEFR